MDGLRNRITGLCYGISLTIFIVVFTIGCFIGANYQSGYVTLSFYITISTAFISALILWAFGNFLKWLYPIMVVTFAYLFSVAFIYSEQLYMYLHHNHGVNDVHLAIDWTFFQLLTAITFLGLIMGIGIKLIIGKVNTTK